MNYEMVRNVAGRIIEGTATVQRLDSEEEQGRISGGRRNVEASLVLGAEKISGQGNEHTGSKSRTYEEVIKEQELLLEAYAKETGCWFDYRKEINKWQYIDNGVEAEVFESKDDRYINKVIRYNIIADITPLLFIDSRISLHNYLFPDTGYELLGFTRDGRGDFSFVLKQPFIEKTGKNLTVEKVNSYLKEEYGLESPYGSGYLYMNSDYILDDIHLKNVIGSKNGTIFFIDTQLFLNRPNGDCNGVRRYLDFKVIDSTIE